MNGKREHQTAAEARKPHRRCRTCAHFTPGRYEADAWGRAFRTQPKCACKDGLQCPLATPRAVAMQFYASMRDLAGNDPWQQLAGACVGMAALDVTEPRGNRSIQDSDREAARWFLDTQGPWGALLTEGAGMAPEYIKARGRAFLAAVQQMEARKQKEVEYMK